MLTQQVREVMMINRVIKNQSRWILLTLEQMGVPLRSEFANQNHGEAGSSKQCNDQTTFFWRLSSQNSFETQKGNSMTRSLKMRLKC